MSQFKQYLQEKHNAQEAVIQMLYIEEFGESLFDLNEDVLAENKLHKALGKVGLHMSKDKGLLGYLKSAGIGMFKLFMAAIRQDKEGVQEVMKTINKGELVDFLLKLDMATLHIITGPIHFIHAVTGIHIGPALDKAKKNAIKVRDVVIDAIKKIKDSIGGLFGSSKEQKYINTLDKMNQDISKLTI